MEIVFPDKDWLKGYRSWRIVQIEDKLHTLYLTCHYSLAFDFYISVQHKHNRNPDHLSDGDFWVTELMNSYISQTDIERFREKEREISFSSFLSKIPPDVGLETDDGSKQIAPVVRIVDLMCQITGFHIAKSTKMLCVKRPRLVPMLDSLVVDCLTGGMDIESGEDVAKNVTDLLERFRDILLFNGNLGALSGAARQLRDWTGLDIGPVRLLEHLIWFDWSFSEREEDGTTTEQWLRGEGWDWNGKSGPPYVHHDN